MVQKNQFASIAISAWAVVNILLMALILLGGDVEDLNNYIEIALWAISIPAVLSAKKWGIAFTIFTLIYTLSTSVGILIYFFTVDPAVWPNFIRVAINIPVIIYLFKVLLGDKIR